MRTWRLLLLSAAAISLNTGCSFFFGPSSRPASTEKIEPTEALVTRGSYLANHVMACVDCHSPRDTGLFSMPPKKGLEFSGGDCFGEELGVPGKMCFPNITPDAQTGIGGWSDGEIMRAVREGVDPKDEALMPGMPYPSYKDMPDEDVRAIVAYLRTVKPINKAAPPSEFGFFVRHVFNTFPEPLEGPVAPVDRTSSVTYGGYLVKMANCKDCHTPRSGISLDEDLLFAGGQPFKIPGVINVVTPNITPDVETGIGALTKEEFIGRFKSFADPESISAVDENHQSIMPWSLYSGMTEEDLGAIYDYLRTVKPIKNKVNKWPGATTAAAQPEKK
jgi:mono/diheme cytochrome c family protein